MTTAKGELVALWGRSTEERGWERGCLHQGFERHARLHPAADAVLAPGQSLTYGELEHWSNQIARKLREEGATTGKIVALGAAEPVAQVAALLGILKAGACFVCIDAEWPQARRELIFEETEPVCTIGKGAPEPGREVAVDREGLARYSGAGLEEAFSHSESPAYVVYTSGSTGRPKGIRMRHGSLTQFLGWMGRNWEIRQGVNVGQWVSLTFDPAYADIFGTLAWGGTLCIADREHRKDPKAIAGWIQRMNVKVLQTVPSFCREMVRIRPEALREMEWMVLGGEAVTLDLAKAWLECYGAKPKLCNIYGPTESAIATWHVINTADIAAGTIPIGQPMAGRNIVVANDHGNLCPPGIQGEIWITGLYLMD